MERQGKGMDLFHSGVTLVMSSIEGLEALAQTTSARCMGSALTLSDNAMRSVLPKYCGYEVCIPGLQAKVFPPSVVHSDWTHHGCKQRRKSTVECETKPVLRLAAVFSHPRNCLLLTGHTLRTCIIRCCNDKPHTACICQTWLSTDKSHTACMHCTLLSTDKLHPACMHHWIGVMKSNGVSGRHNLHQLPQQATVPCMATLLRV